METPHRHGSRHRSERPGPSRERSRSRSFRDRERELDAERERLVRMEQELRRDRDYRSRSRQVLPHRALSKVNDRSRDNNNLSKEPKLKSPSFSADDIIKILSGLKSGVSNQPLHSGSKTIDFQNIIPNFDPAAKNQRIDTWVHKVNECASVYGWDDKTTTHLALQKLQGLAKTWYESQRSIKFTWEQWQAKIINAFPSEQNYGQMLEEMLARKSRFNEPIEVYYYEKLALINQCELSDRRAVDCIIHGISDKTMKSSALALRCTNPDQLLQFLMSNRESSSSSERPHVKKLVGNHSASTAQNNRSGFRPNQSTSILCFNCKEKGHPYLQCPKPINRCKSCHKIGHNAEDCKSSKESKPEVKRTMCITNSNPNNKFYKRAKVNGVSVDSFVDFGSEVTLLKESFAAAHKILYTGLETIMRGFGNGFTKSLGEALVNLDVDGIRADVYCKIVADHLLDKPLLVGQSFTEQPHIVVHKDATTLKFMDISQEIPFANAEVSQNSTVKVMCNTNQELYGETSVKSFMERRFSGNVILGDKLIGKPNQQFIVIGGVYKVNNGILYICLKPINVPCLILENIVLGRAEKVDIINNITQSSDSEMDSEADFTKINIGQNVPEAVRDRLDKLLFQYKHCFASNMRELGCTNITEMNIELSSNRAIVYRPYRLSHHERERVRVMIDEMLQAGIIRESKSEYSSPIILVKKKGGDYRMCVDFRMLNSVTIKERYPMPIIEDEIARLAGQAWFITLDLASGYYQVPIGEQSKHLTSFVTPDGQFEFNRMPFGLANAPAVFQRMMNQLLGSSRFSKAMAYIDDLLIYGKDPDECLDRLEDILKLIEKANLTLNLSKCQFLMEDIDYLGYQISSAGMQPGEKKIISVANFPKPSNVHQVRQFLGLVSYFRKFIEGFATIAYPLTKLLKKDALWDWGDLQDRAFEELKTRLITRPILTIYDPKGILELHTDASKIGIGGILFQKITEEDSLRPIAYYSRQTSPEEKHFHSYELETLAVVDSLRKFRVYLVGKEFVIKTDCSALRSTFVKRDIIPRIARWWLRLQEFHCTIEYKAGSKMLHVDALSRNPISNSEGCDLDELSIFSVMTINNEDWLHTLQLADPELQRTCDILTNDLDPKDLQHVKDNYVIKDNKLFKCIEGNKEDLRWVVPKGARWQVCRINHDEIGHFGVEKTLDRIKKSYWFPKMSKFVKKYVESCIQCAYTKHQSSNHEGLLHPIPKGNVPFETIHADHLGPFTKSKRGNCYLLVIIDAFTKFVFVKPVRNTKTTSAIKVFDEIFYTFSTPVRLITDRGSCFTSHLFKKFCLDKGIKHVLNSVASPRSNGQVERYNRTILNSLKAQNLNLDERVWDEQVGRVQWGLNNTIQKSTGKTPSELMFGMQMNGEINSNLKEIILETQQKNDLGAIRQEVKDKLDQEQQKQKEYYDQGRIPAKIYAEGDLVKITKTSFNNDGKSKKLLPSYTGPFKVTKVLGNDRYKIESIPGFSNLRRKNKSTVAADRMKPWVHIAALQLHDSDVED